MPKKKGGKKAKEEVVEPAVEPVVEPAVEEVTDAELEKTVDEGNAAFDTSMENLVDDGLDDVNEAGEPAPASEDGVFDAELPNAAKYNEIITTYNMEMPANVSMEMEVLVKNMQGLGSIVEGIMLEPDLKVREALWMTFSDYLSSQGDDDPLGSRGFLRGSTNEIGAPTITDAVVALLSIASWGPEVVKEEAKIEQFADVLTDETLRGWLISIYS